MEWLLIIGGTLVIAGIACLLWACLLLRREIQEFERKLKIMQRLCEENAEP